MRTFRNDIVVRCTQRLKDSIKSGVCVFNRGISYLQFVSGEKKDLPYHSCLCPVAFLYI